MSKLTFKERMQLALVFGAIMLVCTGLEVLAWYIWLK